MPHVQITWVEGRTAEQKRKVVERITQALEEGGRAQRENIHVAFLEVDRKSTRLNSSHIQKSRMPSSA